MIKPSFKDSLKAIQDLMREDAERSGINSEEDVIEWMREVRKEFVEERYNLIPNSLNIDTQM